MTLNLAPKHDPGGKVKTALRSGVVGDAEFCGENDCRRLWLSREWTRLPGEETRAGYMLFIGMNPSTADAGANDPTITREMFFANREGFAKLFKCNVMDYRATHPKDLRAAGIQPCGPDNLATIRRLAADATVIVAAWGALHKSLRSHADNVETMLRADGRDVWCLGLTEDLSPRHPLYLRGDTPLMILHEAGL